MVIHLNERRHFEDLYLIIVILFSVLFVASIYAPIYAAVSFHSEVFTPGIVYPRFLLNMALVPCYSVVLLVLVHLCLCFKVIACFFLHEVNRQFANLLWKYRGIGLILTFFTWTGFFVIVFIHLLACLAAFFPATAFFFVSLFRGDPEVTARIYPSYRGACSTSFAYVVWIAFPFVVFPKSYTLPQVNKPQKAWVIFVSVAVFLLFSLGLSTLNVASLTVFVWDLLAGDPQLQKSRSIWALVSAGFVYSSWLISLCLVGIRLGELFWAHHKPILVTLSSEIAGVEHSESKWPALAALVGFLGAILGDVCILLYISFTKVPAQHLSPVVTAKIVTSSLMVVYSITLAVQKYVYGRNCFKPSGFLILGCMVAVVSVIVGLLFIPLAIFSTKPT